MYNKELEIAKLAASKAGEFLSNLDVKRVDSAEGKDIKLEADRKSEEIIINTLKPTGIPILSEEIGSIGDQTGLRWIIDPIDGTFNYFRQMGGLYCVSIALWNGNEPILGVVNRFDSDEFIEGYVGQGVKLNGEDVKASKVKDLGQAVYASGFPVKMVCDEKKLSQYLNSAMKFKKIRMLGSATLMSSYVGLGKIDVYLENDIMLWDIAAGAAIIKAGGGEISYIPKEDFKCDFKGFANKELMEAYYKIV